MRLDAALVARGIAPSRERAKEYINDGAVYVDGCVAKKASANVSDDSLLEFRGEAIPFVSRGGLKLQRAMQVFPLSLTGAVCLDIGASTGGFTDCMLQSGASHVFAVDVGHGQLHPKLTGDVRVTNLEGMNIRDLTLADLGGVAADFASVDVSFISLRYVFPVTAQVLAPGATAVCLVKPQFEAGKEKLGKKGVVRSRHTHREVLEQVAHAAAAQGLEVRGVTYSPVKGPEGNIEYLLYVAKGSAGAGAGAEAADVAEAAGVAEAVVDVSAAGVAEAVVDVSAAGVAEPAAFDFGALVDEAWEQLGQ